MQVARSITIVALAVGLAGCGSAGPAESSGGPAGGAPTPAGTTDVSGSPAASDTTAAEIEQILAQALSQPIDLSDPGPALDRAEQGMKDYMRQAGGVAEQLGPDGAAILAGIDAAEKQTIAALIADLRAQAAAQGAGSLAMDGAQASGAPTRARLAGAVIPAPPGGTAPNPQAGGESLFGAFMFTMMAPELYARAPRDASGNLERQSVTEETTLSDGSTIRLTLQPSLAGSKLSADVKVEISVPGPPAHTEEAAGTMSVDLCPDASGTVPLELSLGGGFSQFGGGMQYKVAVKATGHVDDSGKLASMDVQTDGSLGSQPQTGHDALGTAPMYVEIRSGYSVGLGAAGVATNVTTSAPRYSSRVDAAFVRTAVGMTSGMGSFATVLGFQSAEKLWTTGYCVAITVPEMDGHTKIDDPRGRAVSMGVQIDVPSTRVDVGSEKPFTAVVTHRFEAGQLHSPVTASLASGTVSVTPSGTRVPAPATFRYKAPEDPYVDAVVTLETRSRRGIARLVVVFRTVPAGWIIRGTDGTIAGTKCDGPGGDWVEEMVVPSLGMTQKWIFTIDESTLKGTYAYDAKQTFPDGSGTWHGTGMASVTLGPDGTAEISLTGGKTTITTRTSGGTASQSIPGPEGQHSVWMPAGDACR